jgi:CRP/FNR family transcriptional regulator
LTEAEIIAFQKKHFPFWASLSENEQQLFLSGTTITDYKKGENIHSGEYKCLGAIAIINGTLRTYLLSEEGREITLYRLDKGDICILSASCVLENITFDVHIDAESDCKLLVISSPVIASLSQSNVYVQNFTHKLTAERFSDVMWTMQQILFMSFDKRLAVFIVDELSKTGGDVVKLTHEQIAKYTGSAREVVTRMLKYFSQEGYVELSRGEIKVTDKRALKKLASL